MPVLDREEALRLFPEWFGEGDSVERDAMVDAFVEAWALFCSDQAEYAASADPKNAEGTGLDLTGTNRDMPRQFGETDAEYRTRQLADDDVGTPRALLAAIDRILSDLALSGRTAYYYERPDDDAFLISKNRAEEVGTYLKGKRPIRKPTRLYAARTRCEPRHIFMFPRRRLASSSVAPLVTPSEGPFAVLGPMTDDATAPDNAHGHCVIGLPAFIQPGKSLSSDGALHRKPDAPLSEAWGALTEPTAKRARLLSSMFSKATTATRVATNKATGIAIYKATNQPDILVGKIRAVLAHRAMSPVQFTLMFDPVL